MWWNGQSEHTNPRKMSQRWLIPLAVRQAFCTFARLVRVSRSGTKNSLKASPAPVRVLEAEADLHGQPQAARLAVPCGRVQQCRAFDTRGLWTTTATPPIPLDPTNGSRGRPYTMVLCPTQRQHHHASQPVACARVSGGGPQHGPSRTVEMPRPTARARWLAATARDKILHHVPATGCGPNDAHTRHSHQLRVASPSKRNMWGGRWGHAPPCGGYQNEGPSTVVRPAPARLGGEWEAISGTSRPVAAAAAAAAAAEAAAAASRTAPEPGSRRGCAAARRSARRSRSHVGPPPAGGRPTDRPCPGAWVAAAAAGPMGGR